MYQYPVGNIGKIRKARKAVKTILGEIGLEDCQKFLKVGFILENTFLEAFQCLFRSKYTSLQMKTPCKKRLA